MLKSRDDDPKGEAQAGSAKPARKTGASDKPRKGYDPTNPALFINRELSQLAFNERVLEQVKDTSTPLLERVRFATIFSTNMDEFFEVRVAGLKQQVAYGISAPRYDGLSPETTLARIHDRVKDLVAEQYRVLNEELLPSLQKEGIRIWARDRWTKRQDAWIRRHFKAQVQPVLTPIGIDPAHPFPRVLNKALSFIVSVEGKDSYGRESRVAVVQVPRSLPRLIAFPSSVGNGPHDFVLLSSIVHANVGELFPGMRVTGCWQFRITRNSELWVDEEEVENLLHALKGELTSRNYGAAVRLEVADDTPEEMVEFLLGNVDLGVADVYRAGGPVNLHRLSELYGRVDRPDLKGRPFVPGLSRRMSGERDVFEVMRKGDLLLHHPYESFAPVIELLRQAAADPNVLAIKQTLYRTGSESVIVDLLIDAARAGKEVTVVIELRARFDEAENIGLATRLQESGVTVLYGIVGLKAHAKLLLVVRREGRRLRRYAHLGTGNYHPQTARAYTDFGLMTASREIGEDVDRVFMQLTGLGRNRKLKKLLQSPRAMHKTLLGLIADEIAEAKAGRPARIMAKMNSLSEPGIIRALYDASRAGVQVDLIVRGICCLRPGVPGVSENIRVRSIVGRFLEHTRVVHFHAAGKGVTYLSSADWMSRNLFRRVETAFPVETPKLKERVLKEAFTLPLADNARAWELQRDGTYRRVRTTKSARRRSSQQQLMERLGAPG
ncbi:MAG: polyphosphate kinase 1 [Planctomycetota bacterium]|jgi:polyphosphate kinase